MKKTLLLSAIIVAAASCGASATVIRPGQEAAASTEYAASFRRADLCEAQKAIALKILSDEYTSGAKSYRGAGTSKYHANLGYSIQFSDYNSSDSLRNAIDQFRRLSERDICTQYKTQTNTGGGSQVRTSNGTGHLGNAITPDNVQTKALAWADTFSPNPATCRIQKNRDLPKLRARQYNSSPGWSSVGGRKYTATLKFGLVFAGFSTPSALQNGIDTFIDVVSRKRCPSPVTGRALPSTLPTSRQYLWDQGYVWTNGHILSRQPNPSLGITIRRPRPTN